MSEFTRIPVPGTIVEMQGRDERTGQMWKMLHQHVIDPFFSLSCSVFDLSLRNQFDTGSDFEQGCVVDACQAALRLAPEAPGKKRGAVIIKDATITCSEARIDEFEWLDRSMRSPNGIARVQLCVTPDGGEGGGVIFRRSIIPGNVTSNVRSWNKTIEIGRAPVGGIYGSKGIDVAEAGLVELVFTPRGGGDVQRVKVRDFNGPGAAFAEHATEDETRLFYRMNFERALEVGLNLWGGAKETIEKHIHKMQRRIFDEVQAEYADRMQAKGLWSAWELIDALGQRLFRADQEGGILLALGPYDGDVWSDMLAGANSAMSMMESVLVTSSGVEIHDAAHGTVTAHYRRALDGQDPPTNPVGQLSAWGNGIASQAALFGDENAERAGRLILRCAVDAIEDGQIPGDIVLNAGVAKETAIATEAFLIEVGRRLREKLEAGAHLLA